LYEPYIEGMPNAMCRLNSMVSSGSNTSPESRMSHLSEY
jgi:hypothetical protein